MKNDLTFEEETRREKIRDAFTSPLVAACLIFFLQVLLGALQGRILPADTESTAAFLARTLIPLLFSGLAAFLPFAVYNRMVEESLKPVFEKKRLQVRPGLFLAGIAAVCGLGILFRYFAMLLTSAMEDVGFVFIRNIPPTDHPFFFILFSALIPALFFELAFRGIMLERLREWSPAAAVVLSAVVYAFSYMSLDIIPHALVCGLLLGWLYLKTGSILLSFAASAVTNGIIAWLWLSETLSPTVAITCGIVGAAAAVICFLLTKDTPR